MRSVWLALLVGVVGCKGAAAPKVVVKEPGPSYPARPAVMAPSFKVFHQDDNSYILVTKVDASDPEIAAIVWELRDAVQARGFDKLGLSQAFVDGRKPKVWFHLYRGSKCAGETYAKGAYPCGASSHVAGDFTLGSYTDAKYQDGDLRGADGSIVTLWDAAGEK